MRSAWIIMVVVAAVCSGCRTATRVIDEGRVDIEMPEGGNRGYLVGSPPPWEGPKSTVRKMVEMEIETPPIWTPAAPPAQDSAQALGLGDPSSRPSQEGVTATQATHASPAPPSAGPADEQPRYTK